MRRDFGLVNSTVQRIWKDNTKMNSTVEQNGSRISDFESLNDVTLMKRCLSGLSKTEVTMYH